MFIIEPVIAGEYVFLTIDELKDRDKFLFWVGRVIDSFEEKEHRKIKNGIINMVMQSGTTVTYSSHSIAT